MDRSLATLLRSFQTCSTAEDAFRLLPSATGLLSRLSNPLNVTLLSSQILENDILYPRPASLSQSRQIFSVFYTAALRFREDKTTVETAHRHDLEQPHSNLFEIEWIKAVVKGAGESSPRWRHTLMLGGLLVAYTGRDAVPLPSSLRQKLEAALVHASTLSLNTREDIDAYPAVIFVLSHTFNILADIHKRQLNYDLLLPALTETAFFSPDGLDHGYWLGTIDSDVRQSPNKKFLWPARSTSALRIQEIKSRPLVTSLGMLARLLAQSIEGTSKPQLICDTVSRLTEFASSLATAWKQNKLSEVDRSEESQFLEQETLSVSLPPLLHLLRDTMFATIIALRSVLGRLLVDPFLASGNNAPQLSVQTLSILRDMYFISHRFGQTSSAQYMFINFTAIDILNQYPQTAEPFLASIAPSQPPRIAPHPLNRTSDLFFLNTAEHFTLSVSSGTCEKFLDAAMPYIQTQGDRRLGELYEAAHSLVIAVFAASSSSQLVSQHLPFYVETLLQSFPQLLNPRQFRLAIRSVIKLAAPPSAIASNMPMMQAIVLDLLTNRLIQAPENFLPPNPDIPVEAEKPMSGKSVFLLAIIDSLCFLPTPLLQEWLPTSADLLHKINNPIQKQSCQQRLWEVLSNGDMDVERAAACVAWWNSRNGRELVLNGPLLDDEEHTMSGALLSESKL
jgi:hypothetical protein